MCKNFKVIASLRGNNYSIINVEDIIPAETKILANKSFIERLGNRIVSVKAVEC
jgi:hypothetical protein